MFFILSKILGPFVVPSDIAVTLAAFGVVLLFTRFRRTGRALARLGVALLLVVGLTPLGNALMLPLEQRFPPWNTSRGAPTGIIVLGGAIGPELSAARGTPAVNGSAGRIIATVALNDNIRRRVSSTAAATLPSCLPAVWSPTTRSSCSRAWASRARA